MGSMVCLMPPHRASGSICRAERTPWPEKHKIRSVQIRNLAIVDSPQNLVGLATQTQNAAFFERKGPESKPWPRGKPLNRKKESQRFFFER